MTTPQSTTTARETAFVPFDAIEADRQYIASRPAPVVTDPHMRECPECRMQMLNCEC